jgi:hypothetical protein
MELLKDFDVYKTPEGFVYFLLMDDKHKETLLRDTNTEARYILMKEFMDGYSYFDDYMLKQ